MARSDHCLITREHGGEPHGFAAYLGRGAELHAGIEQEIDQRARRRGRRWRAVCSHAIGTLHQAMAPANGSSAS